MSVFHHPHRIYGIVQTPMGAFNVSRGLVEAPDDVGATLGWRRVDGDDPPSFGATVTDGSVSPAQEPHRLAAPAATGIGSRQKSSSPVTPATHAGPVDDQLGDVVVALRELLRSRQMVTVPSRGIDLVFDAGILAACRECGVTWRVSRAHYRQSAWWSCPRGCVAAGTVAALSPTT